MKFKNICVDLQETIVKKMDFQSIKELESSSKHGRAVAKTIPSGTIVLKVAQLEFQENSAMLHFEKDEKTSSVDWIDFKERMDTLPLLEVETVERPASLDIITRFLQEAEIYKSSTTLALTLPNNDECEIFQRITDIFDVTSLKSKGGFAHDFNIFQLNAFKCLNLVQFPVEFTPDDVFLNHQAASIFIFKLQSFPDLGRTMNIFFKQWYVKEREIVEFRISIDASHPSSDPAVLFEGLPFEEVPTFVMSMRYGPYRTFTIDRGDRKLEILYDDEMIFCSMFDPNISWLPNSVRVYVPKYNCSIM